MSITINRWTPEEDALLRRHGDDIVKRGQWHALAAARFPGRSGEACRIRYQTLQRRALGFEPKPRIRASAAKGHPTFVRRVDREAEALAEGAAARNRCHTTITGYVFGDPLPGRSALDKRNAEARA